MGRKLFKILIDIVLRYFEEKILRKLWLDGYKWKTILIFRQTPELDKRHITLTQINTYVFLKVFNFCREQSRLQAKVQKEGNDIEL